MLKKHNERGIYSLNSEKLRILLMIQDGKISVAEGMELLNNWEAIGGRQAVRGAARHLRIRINGDKAQKVNINIPLGMMKFFSRFAGMGIRIIPEDARRELERKGVDLSDINVEELVSMIDRGVLDSTLVDIDVDDPLEGRVKVKIYLD